MGRLGAWEARPCTTSKPPSSVHRALVCTKRAGDTMSLSVQRPCCKVGKAYLFAWLLMWVNCPISNPSVEGALYVYVKPKDIFVDQGLLRFEVEALDERARSAGPQALQSNKGCRATRPAAQPLLTASNRFLFTCFSFLFTASNESSGTVEAFSETCSKVALNLWRTTVVSSQRRVVK